MTAADRSDGPSLRIGGLAPFTTVDFPGRLSAVIFCQGCPWRCRYCHNTHLQPFSVGTMTWAEAGAFLQNRCGLLDAVVFSGGEPTAQPALFDAIQQTRGLGYLVGIHTAGIYPRTFARVLPSLDWVGFDVKAPLDDRYDAVVGRPEAAAAVRKSLKLLLNSDVAFELRTTVHPALLDSNARQEISRELAALGAPPTRWQPFRTTGCQDASLIAAG